MSCMKVSFIIISNMKNELIPDPSVTILGSSPWVFMRNNFYISALPSPSLYVAKHMHIAT